MAAPHHRRKTAMRLLRRGEISVAEAAAIALVSRQRVLIWCANAGIDPSKAKADRLAVIMERMNRLDSDGR